MPKFKIANYLLFSLLSITLLSIFAKAYPYFPFDPAVSKLIQSINLPFFDQLMILLTRTGDKDLFFSLLIAFSTFFIIFRKTKEAVFLIISSLGSIGISEIIKGLVTRPRPETVLLIRQLESFQKSDSFPSGHVLNFLGFWGFLLFLTVTLVERSLLRQILLIVLILLLILVGPSRIYLGAHWPSDVLGSYLIGSVWILLMTSLYKMFKHN